MACMGRARVRTHVAIALPLKSAGAWLAKSELICGLSNPSYSGGPAGSQSGCGAFGRTKLGMLADSEPLPMFGIARG